MKLGRIVVLLSLFVLPLAAQTTSIRGRVALPEGDVLPGVTVMAENLGVSTVTDQNGEYVLAVPAGTLGPGWLCEACDVSAASQEIKF